jgi:peptidoglycan/LPS O-acetylase OafA/YrhL
MGARGYLPTLDGWRAVAVLSVILYHDSLHSFGVFTTAWFHNNGSFGVDIFFGISGLLICSRLLEEEKRNGRISLKGFYLRRAFRILPGLLGYLLCAAGLAALGIIPLARKEWFASLLFGRNYNLFSRVPGHNDWYTGHFWSLAVEEHFYLLLPGLLVFVPKRWRVAALGTLALCVEIWRVYRQQSRPWLFLFQHTDIRLDSLLIPAICAVLLGEAWWRQKAAAILKFWPCAAVLVVCLLATDRFPIGRELALPFLFPMIVMGTMLFPGGVFARVLELSLVRWIGRMSYSLYLWQQLFFTGHYFAPRGPWQMFPLHGLLLLACATASYYCIEKPMMSVGRRLMPPAVPGREAVSPVAGAVWETEECQIDRIEVAIASHTHECAGTL